MARVSPWFGQLPRVTDYDTGARQITNIQRGLQDRLRSQRSLSMVCLQDRLRAWQAIGLQKTAGAGQITIPRTTDYVDMHDRLRGLVAVFSGRLGGRLRSGHVVLACWTLRCMTDYEGPARRHAGFLAPMAIFLGYGRPDGAESMAFWTRGWPMVHDRLRYPAGQITSPRRRFPAVTAGQITTDYESAAHQ